MKTLLTLSITYLITSYSFAQTNKTIDPLKIKIDSDSLTILSSAPADLNDSPLYPQKNFSDSTFSIVFNGCCNREQMSEFNISFYKHYLNTNEVRKAFNAANELLTSKYPETCIKPKLLTTRKISK